MDETGLTKEQLLLVVAKSALVRHLATGADKDRFVLKGGTLLAHVYRSPRQSVRDADYTYINPTLPTIDDLIAMLSISGQEGFYLDPNEAQWKTGADIYEAKGMRFSIKNVDFSRRRGSNQLDISMSVRSGECLDEPVWVLYHDPMLAGVNKFVVQGLTLEELATEKILGWVSKDQVRHYIDLAYIARDYWDVLDHEKISWLLKEKFNREKHAGRYRNIKTVAQLIGLIHAPQRIEQVRRGWEERLGTEVLFLPNEDDRSGSLCDFANVERYISDVWVELLQT